MPASFTRFVVGSAVLFGATLGARAQTVLFSDDFENGLAQWTTVGRWHVVGASSPCTSAMPYPSGAQAARFGDLNSCTFGGAAPGTMTTVAPISIPPDASGARLRFMSFESTECGTPWWNNVGGNCGWDHRYVHVSTNGGQSWTTIWQGGKEKLWMGKSVDLSAYLGLDLLLRFDFDPVDTVDNGYPGWVIDDVRVEIDEAGAPASYCTAKLNSLGCYPLLSYEGSPSLTGPDDFRVTCWNLRNNVASKLVWSLAPNSAPFHGGTLCVQAPAHRTTVTSSGNSAITTPNCTGSYTWFFSHAYAATTGIVPGVTIYVQGSARDPGFAPPGNHSLSAAFSVPFLP